VLKLANRLCKDGIDASIDQYEQSPPESWAAWCEAEIEKARFVVMVCTAAYRRRVTRKERPGKGKGVLWEARLIRQYLYEADSVSDKFVPVLFANGTSEHVPMLVRGATRYRVDTPEGYDGLLRLLTSQPLAPKPPVGPRKLLAPQSHQLDAGDELPSEVAQRAKVVIVYYRENASHEKRVQQFAAAVASRGVDAVCDHYLHEKEAIPQGLFAVRQNQILYADYVILVCTESIYNNPQSDLISQTESISYKVVPVIFSGTDASFIPPFATSFPYFAIDNQTGFENLLRRISVSRAEKPPMRSKADRDHFVDLKNDLISFNELKALMPPLVYEEGARIMTLHILKKKGYVQ
jgi:hypothetical protein